MIAKRIPNERGTSSPSRLVRYMVNAKGGVDPRLWQRTAGYILDTNSETNKQGEKVGGVRVTNCGTDDPAAATILIEATQAANKRSKGEKTYHLVFSFPPGEHPPLETLHTIEDELCQAIGLSDHQRVSAVHIDRDHLHVHVAVNKVHPESLRNVEPFFDKRALSKACQALEQRFGLTPTHERQHEIEVNHERDAKGRSTGRDDEREPRVIHLSARPEYDSRFRQHLRLALDLPVAGGQAAEALHGLRNLSGRSLAQLATGNPVLLPGDASSQLRPAKTGGADGVRRAGDGASGVDGPSRTGSVKTAVIEEQTGLQTLARYVAEEAAPQMRAASSWQALHAALAGHGLVITPSGAGLAIGDPGLKLWTKASHAGREFSASALTKRLGPFEVSKTSLGEAARRYQPKPLQKHPATDKLFTAYTAERDRRAGTYKAALTANQAETARFVADHKAWDGAQRAVIQASARGLERKLMMLGHKNHSRAALQRGRAELRKRRESLRLRAQMPSWPDWLAQRAQGGDLEALEVLRGRQEREQRLNGDLLTPLRADKARTALLAHLKPRVLRDGSVLYTALDGGTVLDRKSLVQSQQSSAGAALLAVTLAAERFSGQPLAVEGTAEFKRNVAYLAGLHGLTVTFADPQLERYRHEAIAAKAAAEKQTAAEAAERAARATKARERREQQEARAAVFNAKAQASAAAAGKASEPPVPTSAAESALPAVKHPAVTVDEASGSPVPTASAPAAAETVPPPAKRPAANADKVSEPPASSAVAEWIKRRNGDRDRIPSLEHHRLWNTNDTGAVTYRGLRKMEDGSEVLLFKKKEEMLVKPSPQKVVARATHWKIGKRLTINSKGWLKEPDRGLEL